jgi:uncharacterized membrane protein YbhN (UPF0104 family)
LPTVRASGRRAPRAVLWGLRALLSAACIGFVVASVDLAALAAAMRGVAATTLGAVALLHMAILALIALRWQLILRLFGAVPGYRTCLGLTIVATFFNLVLPLNVAGDALRIVLGARSGIAHGVGLASVVIDRSLGFVGLGGLVLGAFLLGGGHGLSPVVPIVVLAFAAAPLLLLATFALACRLRPGLVARLPAWSRPIAGLATGARRNGAALVFAAGLAVLCHLLSALAMTRLAHDLGHAIALGEGLALFPGVLLAGMLPISFGGWGAREVAAIEILAGAGIPAAVAISISLLFIGVLLAGSALFAAGWFLSARRAAVRGSA